MIRHNYLKIDFCSSKTRFGEVEFLAAFGSVDYLFDFRTLIPTEQTGDCQTDNATNMAAYNCQCCAVNYIDFREDTSEYALYLYFETTYGAPEPVINCLKEKLPEGCEFEYWAFGTQISTFQGTEAIRVYIDSQLVLSDEDDWEEIEMKLGLNLVQEFAFLPQKLPDWARLAPIRTQEDYGLAQGYLRNLEAEYSTNPTSNEGRAYFVWCQLCEVWELKNAIWPAGHPDREKAFDDTYRIGMMAQNVLHNPDAMGVADILRPLADDLPTF